jgi:hypothetical protein
LAKPRQILERFLALREDRFTRDWTFTARWLSGPFHK